MHNTGMSDSTIVAAHSNPAVPSSVLEEVYDWRQHGISMEDVVDRLRPRTVPTGYVFTNWKPGWFYIVHVYTLYT